MLRRRRPLLRAAVVGGGAYMAGKSHARHQAERDQYETEQDSRLDDLEGQQAPPAAPAPAAAPAPPAAPAPASMTDQLSQLATLHQQGALTDSEFAAAKAKLFGT
jgi:Short C-terminal domain